MHAAHTTDFSDLNTLDVKEVVSDEKSAAAKYFDGV
jgi:hypothetical protein